MIVSPEELKAHFPSLLEGVEEGDVAALISHLAMQEVGKNHVLIRDGDDSNALYLVWEGDLVAYIESETLDIELGKLGPGDWIGEISILDPGPATATVQATSASKLLVLSRESLTSLSRAHPRMYGRVVRALIDQMAARLKQVDHMMYGEAEALPKQRWTKRIFRTLLGHGEHA